MAVLAKGPACSLHLDGRCFSELEKDGAGKGMGKLGAWERCGSGCKSSQDLDRRFSSVPFIRASHVGFSLFLTTTAI